MVRGGKGVLVGALLLAAGACGGSSSSGTSSDEASSSTSEVAVSVVGGALNNTAGSILGWNAAPRRPLLRRVLDELAPVHPALAATWTCTGGTLSPTFDGPAGDPYAWTPVSCSVSWANGRSASSEWSGPFALSYGASCDATHPRIANQAGGCALARTTGSGGVTRTVTGPEGNAYAVSHDTNGAGTGWDTSVSPAPTNGGVVLTCAAGGCDAGATLVVNGSHLTGTVTPANGSATKIWDHTVSTGTGGLNVVGSGTARVVSGTVFVQHNLARYTASVTFDAVGFGSALCCFPTTGSVTATLLNGADSGKTESLAFGGTCGEATLTRVDGSAVPLTLKHCL